MTNYAKNAVLHYLLQHSKNGKLIHYTITAASKNIESTMSQSWLWKRKRTDNLMFKCAKKKKT